MYRIIIVVYMLIINVNNHDTSYVYVTIVFAIIRCNHNRYGSFHAFNILFYKIIS